MDVPEFAEPCRKLVAALQDGADAEELERRVSELQAVVRSRTEGGAAVGTAIRLLCGVASVADQHAQARTGSAASGSTFLRLVEKLPEAPPPLEVLQVLATGKADAQGREQAAADIVARVMRGADETKPGGAKDIEKAINLMSKSKSWDSRYLPVRIANSKEAAAESAAWWSGWARLSTQLLRRAEDKPTGNWTPQATIAIVNQSARAPSDAGADVLALVMELCRRHGPLPDEAARILRASEAVRPIASLIGGFAGPAPSARSTDGEVAGSSRVPLPTPLPREVQAAIDRCLDAVKCVSAAAQAEFKALEEKSAKDLVQMRAEAALLEERLRVAGASRDEALLAVKASGRREEEARAALARTASELDGSRRECGKHAARARELEQELAMLHKARDQGVKKLRREMKASMRQGLPERWREFDAALSRLAQDGPGAARVVAEWQRLQDVILNHMLAQDAEEAE